MGWGTGPTSKFRNFENVLEGSVTLKWTCITDQEVMNETNDTTFNVSIGATLVHRIVTKGTRVFHRPLQKFHDVFPNHTFVLGTVIGRHHHPWVVAS